MKRKPKDIKFLKNAHQTKYRSVKTVIGAQTFASKKEARHYSELMLRQKAGEIQNLRCQVSFDLIVNGQKVCRYVSDFCYIENGREVVADVKSDCTAKNPVFRLKKRLMKAIHNIEILEVI